MSEMADRTDGNWILETAISFVERSNGSFSAASAEVQNEARRNRQKGDSENYSRWMAVWEELQNIREDKTKSHLTSHKGAYWQRILAASKSHVPGEECSCGGANKNCQWCDGIGIVQPRGTTAASFSARPKSADVTKRKRSGIKAAKSITTVSPNSLAECSICGAK